MNLKCGTILNLDCETILNPWNVWNFRSLLNLNFKPFSHSKNHTQKTPLNTFHETSLCYTSWKHAKSKLEKKTIEIKCVSVLQICYYFTDKNSCNHSQKILRQLSNFSFKPTVIFLQHSFDLIKRKKRYFAKKIVI